MRVLIVGAGAIGQPFGRHFQLGGATVAFLVRPKYAEAARQGFWFYPLNRRASVRWEPERMHFEIFHNQATALAQPWDLVVLAISSLALRSGSWFDELASDLSTTPLLCLQAGPEDPEYVFSRVDRAQVAWGMLAITSYQAPLPHENLPHPGVAYWVMPPAGIGFSGLPAVLDPITTTLARGGMRNHTLPSVATELAFQSALLDKFIIALETRVWSFERLSADRPHLTTAWTAMRESWALAEAIHQVRTPLPLRLIRPWMLRAALALAPRVMPFDLEAFFTFHYAKVSEQTRFILQTQLDQHRAHGVACPATTALAEALDAAREG
jgi:hypothetical protein